MPTVSASNLHFVAVNSAAELEHEVNAFLANADILVQAAAVSDYRVKEPSDFKLKRSILGDEIALELVANPDILAGAVSRIRNEGLNCKVVGFAAETVAKKEQLHELAQAKLMSKGCDIIVANDVSGGKVFDSDENHALILTREGDSVEVSGNKTEVANSILDIIAK
jgi:phosphopantothenoylcysteine decarboxylase/phosphopantothenate--cysteine ligase